MRWRGGPSHKSLRAGEQDRPELAEQRAGWRAGQGQLSPARLVFVDETGAATNMARRYGRSPRGQRVDGPVPQGHWKSTTFVGGLTSRGFVAPYVTDGAMNGAIFKAWTEQMLAPALVPGDIVAMDNLPAHPVSSADIPPGDPASGGSGQRPDGRRHPRGDRGLWRGAALPAALLPGPEPIRRRAPDPIPQGPPP